MSVTKEQVVSALAAVPKKAISQEWSGKKTDTNEELKSMMASMQLKIEDVMRLSMTSYDTVKSWRVNRESKRWRRMPDRTLAYLKMQLGRNP
jgi:pantothenate kinase-related protein Tda10